MPYKNKICGIYCIENICNHKKYIGQSVNIYERWSKHRTLLRKDSHGNQHLQYAWKTYGEENFLFYIIEECCVDKLDELEIYYTNLYNVYDNQYGYNIEPAGKANHTRTIETIEKIKKNRKYVASEDTKRRISEAQIGRKLTDEWKANISNHHKQAIQNGTMLVKVEHLEQYREEQKKEIDCYDLAGTFLRTYSSVHDAARDLNIEATNISKVLTGKYTHCSTFVFYYHEQGIVPVYEIVYRVSIKPLFMIDNSNNLIQFFSSFAEASRSTGILASAIAKVCYGDLKQTHGFRFILATKEMLASYFKI